MTPPKINGQPASNVTPSPAKTGSMIANIPGRMNSIAAAKWQLVIRFALRVAADRANPELDLLLPSGVQNLRPVSIESNCEF